MPNDLERLADEVAKLNNHRFIKIQNSPIKMIAFQFARGLAFGLGTAIGATALLSFAVVLLAQIEFVPIIGDLAKRIINDIEMRDQP